MNVLPIASGKLRRHLLIPIVAGVWMAALPVTHAGIGTWSLKGFAPNDRSFDFFVAEPATTPALGDFGKEKVTFAAVPSGVQAEVGLRFPFRDRDNDNPGPVELRAATDELAVGDARFRLVEINVFRADGRVIGRYDANGAPNPAPYDPAVMEVFSGSGGPPYRVDASGKRLSEPAEGWTPLFRKESDGRLPSYPFLQLVFATGAGEIVAGVCRWKDTADGAQLADRSDTSASGKRFAIQLPCLRAGSGSLQVGFTACGTPWQTGELKPEAGAEARAGELSLRHVAGTPGHPERGPVKSGSSQGDERRWSYRFFNVKPAGVLELVGTSHRETPGRLRWDPAEYLGHDEGFQFLSRDADKSPETPYKFRRLSASKRFVLKLPRLPVPEKDRVPEDPLDFPLGGNGSFDGGFAGAVKTHFGVILPPPPFVGCGTGADPDPGPEIKTLRDALAAYVKPRIDEGKVVDLDPVSGVITAEDPWWKKAGASVKETYDATRAKLRIP